MYDGFSGRLFQGGSRGGIQLHDPLDSPFSNFRAGDLRKAKATSAEAGRKLIDDYLDACQQAGLLALDWTCRWSHERLRYSGGDFAEGFLRFLRDPLPLVVATERTHPALLGYYGPDEPNLAPKRIEGKAGATTIVELCQAYYRAVNAADPYHPSCLFFYGHGKVPVPDWPDTYDMTGQSYFYIGRQPAVLSMNGVRNALADLRGQRPSRTFICPWRNGPPPRTGA